MKTKKLFMDNDAKLKDDAILTKPTMNEVNEQCNFLRAA